LYILAKAVSQIGRDVSFLPFGSAPNPYTGSYSQTLQKSEYISIAKDIASFIDSKKRSPNFVTHKGKKISTDICIFAFSKIIVFYKKNKRMPNTCLFEKPTAKKSSSKKIGKLTSQIQSKTGITISDYKTLYRAFSKASYKYYYNDQKSQKSALSRLKSGLNCVDMNQLAYYSLKEMGYEVRIVRGTVKCNSGTFGHVWCRLKLGGKWINFDASASAKGKALGSVICGSVQSVTDTNPNWLLTDDGKT
jgi:hypothetical protein